MYDAYVSSGQAAGKFSTSSKQEYPYFKRLISKHLPKDRDIVVADCACGNGGLLFCLQRAGYRNSIGVDASREQVQLANDRGIANVLFGDLREFLKKKFAQFDVVFLMDVLEHFQREELIEVLDFVHAAIRPNGLLIAHVPNAEGISGMRVRYGDLTHELCFTRKSIRQVLSVCGFNNVVCFEDQPIVHGLKSAFRFFLWKFLTIPLRLLLVAETGEGGSHTISKHAHHCSSR